MRLSEDRYSRDLRRLELAVRMVRHEARTSTIMAWTGLTHDRVRRIFRSARTASGPVEIRRHRGPVPHDVTVITRNILLRSEAASVAAMCQVLGAIPTETGSQALKMLPSLARGERLCLAYETYRLQIPHPKLTFEQVLLIVRALVEGHEAALGKCGSCGSAILVDRLSSARRVCITCLAEGSGPGSGSGVADGPDAASISLPVGDSLVYQHSLFEG